MRAAPRLTAALLLLALCGTHSQAGPFNRYLATPHDSVTTPGVAVPIEAKFERRLFSVFNPDLQDEPVEFDLGGGVFAQARTDWDGVAALPVRAGAVGIYPFRARLLGITSAPPADGRLFVLDPARPVAVVDIDQTLSDMPSWKVLFWGAGADTYPGAVSLLADLARTHQILYLTARDDAMDGITRAFLARHGFPDGPVIYDDKGLTTADERDQLFSSHHGTFKLGVIQGLQGRGVNVALGIGNAETDAYAYENAGIPSFIRTTKVGSGPSFRFLDYDVLRLELVARGILP